MKRNLLLVLASLTLVVACNEKSGNNNQGPVNRFGDPIIAETFKDEQMVFPENTPRFVSLVKLNNPALLSSVVQTEDGSVSVDESLRDAILAEQEAFEQSLMALSPEIKVLYRYRMVLNAVAIDAPQALANEINEMDMDYIEANEAFSLPTTLEKEMKRATGEGFAITSMTQIGVDKVQEHYTFINEQGEVESLLGQGIRVGIIDSGIDYTHAMLGGSGDVTEYEAIDANQSHPSFPNNKVVGGYDFAGAQFDVGSHLYVKNIPAPDVNPVDLGGHGTHVAGTVAGLGDGVKSYDGAAPGADLFALKVFGDAGGGTSDTVVIAALEYAADPNGDLKLDDRLDVVNLSLGGGFGKPHNLYGQAIKNLVKGGVVTVAAAGNAGPITNIVGAPSTANEAIAVAASIDGMEHNWKFDAVEFKSKNNPSLLSLRIEGPLTKPIAETGSVSGVLHYIGVADVDLTDEVKAQLNGKVALIDRGLVSFQDKVQRAVDGGAIGVVVINNEPGDPIPMGGDISFDIPGVMISQEEGAVILEDVQNTDVTVDFVASRQIEQPELIDSIASFSSQGPRDLDGLLKPEVTAPGLDIISALAGSGSNSVMFSGTSMAAPHIAGAVALLLQHKKNIQAKDVKSLLMNTADLINDPTGAVYPLSRQGAGRANLEKAMASHVVVSQPGLSLGKLPLVTTTDLVEKISLKNTGDKSVSLSLEGVDSQNLKLSLSDSQVSLEPGEEVEVEVFVQALVPEMIRSELEAFIYVSGDNGVKKQIPVLAIANRSSIIHATAQPLPTAALFGDFLSVTLENVSPNLGFGFPFNLLGQDERKDGSQDVFSSVACDMESAGYRIIGGVEKTLEIAVKLYNPVNRWSACDIGVEFDRDGDGVSDLEILGTTLQSLPGLPEIPGLGLAAVLFDSQALSGLLTDYNASVAAQPAEAPGLDLSSALVDIGNMIGFQNSTVAIVTIPMNSLGLDEDKVRMKVSVSANMRNVIERQDVLGAGFMDMDLSEERQSYILMPPVFQLAANETTQLNFLKGPRDADLVVYLPNNPFKVGLDGKDSQSQILSFNPTPVLQNP